MKRTGGAAFQLQTTIKNTGRREGTEILQVYVRRMSDTEGPLKTLKAFCRVPLKAGESKCVTVSLDEEAFTLFDSETNTMRIVPGEYELYYGNSSRREDLKVCPVTLTDDITDN